MQKWQRRKDERPTEILDAALELFGTKGFVSTKIDDIAKQAGVSKGTVYLYYPSKETLFKEMVYVLMLPRIKEVELYISNYQGKQTELLILIINRWWQTIKSSGLTGIPKLIISEADKFPDLTKFYVKEVIHRIHTIVVNVLNNGVKQNEFKKMNTALTARVIMSSLVYFSMWETSLKKYDKKDLKVEDMIEQQIKLVLDGIKK